MKKKIVLTIVGVIILVSAGVALFPFCMEQYVKYQIIKAGDRLLGREITVNDVSYDMWKCCTTVQGIAVPNAPGFSKNIHAVTIHQVMFELAPLDILKKQIHIEKLVIDGICINAELRNIPFSLEGILSMLINKEINLLCLQDIDELKNRKKSPKKSSGKLYIRLDEFEIRNTQVSLVNLTKIFQLTRKKFGIKMDTNYDRISLPDYKIRDFGKDGKTAIEDLASDIFKHLYGQIETGIQKKVEDLKKEIKKVVDKNRTVWESVSKNGKRL